MVWLSLGSNIGDRKSYIDEAFENLKRVLASPVRSRVYETAAQDFTDQPDFLNAVVRGTTQLSPQELLVEIQSIERSHGRDRRNQIAKGPRTLDIDILLYGNMRLHTEENQQLPLTIPHKAMHKRLFVLKPLLDLDPLLCDPRDGVSWATKASQLSDQEVKLYSS